MFHPEARKSPENVHAGTDLRISTEYRLIEGVCQRQCIVTRHARKRGDFARKQPAYTDEIELRLISSKRVFFSLILVYFAKLYRRHH